jgi:mono/diheme cytochrome c family protein
MKNFVLTALLTLAISLLYTGIAYLLPQLPSMPPPEVAMGADVGADQLIPAGQKTFANECSQCHPGRGPDLGGIGGRAADRAKLRADQTGEKYTDIDYLAEAICKPSAFVVDGYGDAMGNPASKLSGGQVQALIAYLQDQGGTATMRGTNVDPLYRFECPTEESTDAGAAVVAGGIRAAETTAGTPEEIVEKFKCAGCHSLDSPEATQGPSLFDVGARRDKAEIYDAILFPNAEMAEGFESATGLMKDNLEGQDFYNSLTPGDYKALVNWLAARKGTE